AARLRIAMIDYAAGRTAIAYRALDDLMREQPDDEQPRLTRARWLIRDGDVAQADRYAREAVNARPESAPAQYTAGLTALAGRDPPGRGERLRAGAPDHPARGGRRAPAGARPSGTGRCGKSGRSVAARGETAARGPDRRRDGGAQSAGGRRSVPSARGAQLATHEGAAVRAAERRNGLGRARAPRPRVRTQRLLLRAAGRSTTRRGASRPGRSRNRGRSD